MSAEEFWKLFDGPEHLIGAFAREMTFDLDQVGLVARAVVVSQHVYFKRPAVLASFGAGRYDVHFELLIENLLHRGEGHAFRETAEFIPQLAKLLINLFDLSVSLGLRFSDACD
jgi:hypothetical protein